MANKIKRGRPALAVNLPEKPFFTVNDMIAANPQITCRLTVYTKRNDLIKSRVIRMTGQTQPTGGVGKPLDILQTMTNYRRSRAAKAAAKTRKLSKATVSLTPADEVAPVTVVEVPAVS